MPSYAPLAELKDRMCISDIDRDLALERCLEGASRWVEQETARRFYITTETRYYTAQRYSSWYPASDISNRPGGGSTGITIDDLIILFDDEDEPIYPTLATDEDGDRIFEVEWTFGTDFWLEPFNARANGQPYRRLERNLATGRYTFPLTPGGIALTGAFGYGEAVPAAIREATLDAAEILALPVLDLGLAGVAQYQIGSDLRVTLKPDELPPSTRAILMAYKAPPFG